MQHNSPTMDEPAHIARGYHYLITGKLSLDPSPPLMNALSALPLLLQKGIIIPPPDPMHGFSTADFADKFVWLYNDANTVINSARLTTVLLSVVLGYSVYCWARHLWGTAAGLLALILYVFDPNILAHSQLATTDLGVTCFIFLAVFYLWQFLRSRRNAYLVVAGIVVGLAQAVKFSALILVPVFVLALACEVTFVRDWTLRGCWPWQARFAGGRRGRPGYFFAAVLIAVLCLSFLSLWASYGFELAPLAPRSVPQVVSRLMDHPLLRNILDKRIVPATTYLRGLRWIRRRSERSTPIFLMGKYSDQGWWYYPLVAFVLKTPLPTLILITLIILLSLRNVHHRTVPRGDSPPHTGQREYILSLPIVCLLSATVILPSVPLAYRHILPILPFAFVLISRLILWCRRPAARAALAAVVLWYVSSTMRIFPHTLAYFNEFAGGPSNGYQYLIASDLDWGQDLKNLKEYLDQAGRETVHLAYYGSAHPEYYGIQAQPLPTYGPLVSTESPQLYAISATYLQGGYLDDPATFAWLRQHAPVRKIGYSIFVYELE